MTELEADEIVHQRRRRDRMPAIDKLLAATGILLASFGTFFPWYAFFHQEQFSIPTLWQGDTRDMPEQPARQVMSISPQAMPDENAQASLPPVDPLITATVPAIAEPPPQADPEDAAVEQPFPSSGRYTLMHVANGRALIEDATGMYLVRVGSVLPDNSRLATLEQRDGRWVLITSNGDVVVSQ